MKEERSEKKKRKFHNNTFREQVKRNKGLFTIYVLLRVSVILVMIAQFFNHNYENVFLCLLTLVLFFIPTFIETNYHIDIPDTLEIIMLLFIYAAEILGEIANYYQRFPIWDTMLHTMTGFLAAAIGFSLVDILNRNDKIKFELSPFYMAFVAFCFSMTVAAVWEIFEFFMDNFFGKDMQKDTIIHTIRSVMLDPDKSNKVYTINNIGTVVVNGEELGFGGYLDIGLYDTMKDIIVNFIGAVVFSFIGYFYTKGKGKGKFASRFIPVIGKASPKEETLPKGEKQGSLKAESNQKGKRNDEKIRKKSKKIKESTVSSDSSHHQES